MTLRKKMIKKFCMYFFSFALALLLFVGLQTKTFISTYFPQSSLSQILFFITSDLSGVDKLFVQTYIITCIVKPLIFTSFLVFFPQLYQLIYLISKKLAIKKYCSYLFKNYIQILFLTLLFVIYTAIIYIFLTHPNTLFAPKGTFYEEHYVDSSRQNFNFPARKRNLIIITLESFEKTFSNKNFFDEDLIAPLQILEKEGISFQNYTNGFETYITQPYFIALFGGVPTNILHLNMLNMFGKNIPQIQNVYTLGKILKNNGYHTLFIGGTDTNFAGQKQFLQQNGFNETYIDKSTIKKEYPLLHEAGNWGYGDKDIFKIAEDYLSDQKQPFFAIINTIDTHHNYNPKIKQEKTFSKQEYKAIYNTAFETTEFIKHLKNQPFYKNTTIVLLGDHLRQGTDFDMPPKRSIYNLFINAASIPNNLNRTFTQIDLFPTILEAIGVKWKTHKLSLGTSVFSDNKTLEEQFGSGFLRQKLSERNDLYKSLW